MNTLSRVLPEINWIINRCRQRFACALAFTLAIRAINLILLGPLAAAILRLGLSRWGRASVGNFELISFALSPEGIVALLAVATILLASTYLELAGLLRLLADDSLHWWEAFRSSRSLIRPLIVLGLRQLVVYVVLAIPFGVGVALTYGSLWRGMDLNGLIVLQPPVFWWGAGLAGLIVVGYLVVAAWFFLRWVYAVPILCLEPMSAPSVALQESVRRGSGNWQLAAAGLGLWLVGGLGVVFVTYAVSDFLSDAVLRFSSRTVSTSLIATGLVLLANAFVALMISVLGNLTLAGVILSLYRRVAPPEALVHREPSDDPRHLRVGWLFAVGLLVAGVIAASGTFFAIASFPIGEPVEITAHRAGATHGPENTIAALKQAIVDGAEWAEIDVQNTADGKLVVMHDTDLARVGGGRKRVDQATLEEIRQLDVGSQFGSAFAGERISTLDEFLTAAGNDIRLNIELKPHSAPDGEVLTRRVIDAVQRAGHVDRCRLCSQSYESLQLARQLEPRIPVGYIVATAIGSPEKLNVDFLMVKSSFARRQLVDRAKARDITVHAWTVNDPSLVAPLIDAGVTNLITDDPVLIRNELNEIRQLDTVQRLLLRARNAILQ